MDDLILFIIYAAILILGGLASAYRKKNQRKQVSPHAPGQQGRQEYEVPTGGFDPFEQLFGEPKYKRKIDTPPEPKMNIPKQTNDISLEVPVEEASEEGIPVFKETEEILLSDNKFIQKNKPAILII